MLGIKNLLFRIRGKPIEQGIEYYRHQPLGPEERIIGFQLFFGLGK